MIPPEIAPSLVPDFEAAARFIEVLAGSRDALMCFQTFDDVKVWGKKKDRDTGLEIEAWIDRKDDSLVCVLNGTLAGCWEKLIELNARGAGVFYTVNVTDGRGRLASNVIDLRALFVDKDDDVLPDDVPGVSARILSSPGKEQALWLLKPGEPRQDFTSAQKRLIHFFQSDKGIHDLPRVLRLPGTLHKKWINDPERGAHLVEAWYAPDLTRRTIPEVLSRIPAVRLVQPGETPRRPKRSRRDKWDLEVASFSLARGNRNNTLFRVARLGRDLLEVGEISEAEVREKLADACDRNGLAEEEPEKTQSAIDRALAVDESLLSFLVKDDRGTPKSTLANVIRILVEAEGWQGVLGFNERTRRAEILREPPWDSGVEGHERALPRAIGEEDGARLCVWFNRHQMSITVGIALSALQLIAQQNPFDRVRQYFEALPAWDQVRRCRYWLRDFAGADDTPYVHAVSMRWLIAAIARTFEPGCQVDSMLVLEGMQGAGKSSLLRALAGVGHFYDGRLVIGEKDALMLIHGPLCCEMSDLASIRSARDEETIKQFLSIREDQFRRPYGRTVETWPRRSIFAGSTNLGQYLRDETGARRFWGVRCRVDAVDIDGFLVVRDQLWAEALARYQAGEQWHLTTEEKALAEEEADQRYEHDALEDAIAVALRDGVKRDPLSLGLGQRGKPGDVWGIPPQSTRGVSTSQILEFVCGDRDDRKPGTQQRIARAMRRLGWEQYRDPAPTGPRFWEKILSK